jgi:hypothetical protein
LAVSTNDSDSDTSGTGASKMLSRTKRSSSKKRKRKHPSQKVQSKSEQNNNYFDDEKVESSSSSEETRKEYEKQSPEKAKKTEHIKMIQKMLNRLIEEDFEPATTADDDDITYSSPTNDRLDELSFKLDIILKSEMNLYEMIRRIYRQKSRNHRK